MSEAPVLQLGGEDGRAAAMLVLMGFIAIVVVGKRGHGHPVKDEELKQFGELINEFQARCGPIECMKVVEAIAPLLNRGEHIAEYLQRIREQFEPIADLLRKAGYRP